MQPEICSRSGNELSNFKQKWCANQANLYPKWQFALNTAVRHTLNQMQKSAAAFILRSLLIFDFLWFKPKIGVFRQNVNSRGSMIAYKVGGKVTRVGTNWLSRICLSWKCFKWICLTNVQRWEENGERLKGNERDLELLVSSEVNQRLSSTQTHGQKCTLLSVWMYHVVASSSNHMS